MKTIDISSVATNQPMYLYQEPMFKLTVSVVMIVEDGVVVLVNNDGICQFPGGSVRPGVETIQFSAVRHFKEQTKILMQKDLLLPVDFRSSPERSAEGNVVDIGMLAVPENVSVDNIKVEGLKWLKVDFSKRKLFVDHTMYMDHDVLLERAIDLFLMMK